MQTHADRAVWVTPIPTYDSHAEAETPYRIHHRRTVPSSLVGPLSQNYLHLDTSVGKTHRFLFVLRFVYNVKKNGRNKVSYHSFFNVDSNFRGESSGAERCLDPPAAHSPLRAASRQGTTPLSERTLFHYFTLFVGSFKALTVAGV